MLRFNTLCLIAVGILVVFPVHGDRDEESSENTKAGADLEAGRLLAEHLVKRVEGTCESGREAYDQAHDGGVDALKKCVHALEDYAKGVRMHEQLAYSTHGRYRRAFVQTYALLSSVLEKDKKNLYKFKETFKADHQKAADYLKGRLDKIKETADEMAGKEPQDATAAPEVSSLLSQSSTAAKRHAVKKSATAVKRRAVKNRHAAVMKTRALKKASTAAKRHAETSALEKYSTAAKKHAVKNLQIGASEKAISAMLRKEAAQAALHEDRQFVRYGKAGRDHGRRDVRVM
jgi:hypothetical protein